MVPPTRREGDVLAICYEYAERGEKLPSLQKMANRLNVDKRAVYTYVSRLIKKGYLSREYYGELKLVPLE